MTNKTIINTLSKGIIQIFKAITWKAQLMQDFQTISNIPSATGLIQPILSN